jgi:hypothetical protein
MSLAK